MAATQVSSSGWSPLGALSPTEFSEEVNSTSELIRVVEDSNPQGKGRHLVATRAISPGEVVLIECPLVGGSTTFRQRAKAFDETILKAADTSQDLAFLVDSPVCDCVADVVLAKEQAHALGQKSAKWDKEDCERAGRRLRRLNSLCRTAKEDAQTSTDLSSLLQRALHPHLQELITEAEIRDIMLVLSSNGFGGSDSELEVMFAGSMFEHSCMPNVFVAAPWRRTSEGSRQQWRASRPIEEGEALSIDYVNLPQSYFAHSNRSKVLEGWGFECSCPRCTTLPEIARAFVCPTCKEPELCPGPPKQDPLTMTCRGCKTQAEAEYVEKCLSAEELASTIFSQETTEDVRKTFLQVESILGECHYVNFNLSWHRWMDGPNFDSECTAEELEEYGLAADHVIKCLSRLCDSPLHPELLSVYHSRALLEHGDVESQHSYLELERAVMQRFYPDECDQQDAEIMHMVQCMGPPSQATKKEDYFFPEPEQDKDSEKQKQKSPNSAQLEDSKLGEKFEKVEKGAALGVNNTSTVPTPARQAMMSGFDAQSWSLSEMD